MSVTDQTYRDRVYFDLEAQRTTHRNALLAALQAVEPTSINLIPDWCRVTDWTWSNTPLSPAGSLKGIGQRFNIGETLDRARGQSFPCLYIGQDEETARIEKFGVARSAREDRLSTYEFALRSPDAFTTFPLHGHVDEVLDLREMRRLRPFVDIIKRFNLSSDTIAYAKKHKFPQRTLVTTVVMLRNLLLAPPSWREEPQNYGIPAPSQIFGRLVRDAGFEGILYPSQRGGQLCLALFPENFRDSSSEVHVRGTPPPAASCYKLNKDNLCL
ncbi:hypothetical protein HNQ60_000951 [Povalibacter uvarum]|uniref:RES domain-containing protein n=1 Tax=Povalibacter uvarum TaxID=732238 RepID=A0A841HJA0_9GAMM|nr:hypothetical protein [Povalibacter uvarum]